MALDTGQKIQLALRGTSMVLTYEPAGGAEVIPIYNLINSGGLIGTGSNVVGPGGIVAEEKKAA